MPVVLKASDGRISAGLPEIIRPVNEATLLSRAEFYIRRHEAFAYFISSIQKIYSTFSAVLIFAATAAGADR